ncbi:Uncharacterised protein [Salmonella enterica subsp. enterica]|uniref:Uncharacterized protein n=1 Tax=Salmonella enterica I TaxID=59201 RepID=A0A379Y3G7_SALET|nr:Uncharacterised protein [Salmonella enterica subsp. enterica]
MTMELASRENFRGNVISLLTHAEEMAVKHLSDTYRLQHCTTIRLKSWCALYGQSR